MRTIRSPGLSPAPRGGAGRLHLGDEMPTGAIGQMGAYGVTGGLGQDAQAGALDAARLEQ